jgi:hypothetical protein
MRLRRGEHARLHTGRWAVIVTGTRLWLRTAVTGRGRWSW